MYIYGLIPYHICYILPAPCILYLNYLHSIFELNALYIYIFGFLDERSRGAVAGNAWHARLAVLLEATAAAQPGWNMA